MHAFHEYDWCSFVFNELSTSIGKFKKTLRMGKRKRIYEGNCAWLCLFFSREFVVFNIVIISDLFWINVIDVTLMHVKYCAVDILLATLSNRK